MCIRLISLIVVWRAIGMHTVFYQSANADCRAESSNTTRVRGRSCYEFHVEAKTWTQARDYCHERSGRLVSITGSELQTFLSNTAAHLWPHKSSVWLGLNRWSDYGVFVWDSYDTSDDFSELFDSLDQDALLLHRAADTGGSMLYNNWAEGYPRTADDGKCVLMHRDSGWRWTTNACWGPYSYRSSFVCEYVNMDAAEAVATFSPSANTTALDSGLPYQFDSAHIVHHAGVLYIAVAAAVIVIVIVCIYICIASNNYCRSRLPIAWV